MLNISHKQSSIRVKLIKVNVLDGFLSVRFTIVAVEVRYSLLLGGAHLLVIDKL